MILVTLDGLLPDSYEHPDAHGLKIPTLRSLVARGASSDGALTVFPSVTYPSHTSMTTGVSPGAHGIVGNRTFDPLEEDDQEGWRCQYAEDIRRDPIWRPPSSAPGYPRGALVHWPVSVGARVTWVVPEYWRAKNDNDRKLLRALSTPGLLESVAAEHPDFWPRYAPPDVKDDALTDIATHILATGRPTLLQLHLVQVDGAQHHFGVWSPEAVAAIENDDRQLARIFSYLETSGLAKDTSVIVASDHGFMNAPKMVRPGVLLRQAGLVTTDAGGHVMDWKASVLVNSGQSVRVPPRPGRHRDGRRRPKDLRREGRGGGQRDRPRLRRRAAIRTLGGDPAAFLALEAAPGYQLGPGFSGEYAPASSVYKATHGYDPNRPEMHASLILTGPGIAHGTLAGARLVDIGPTIAAWLGVSMPGVEGKPLQVTPRRDETRRARRTARGCARFVGSARRGKVFRRCRTSGMSSIATRSSRSSAKGEWGSFTRRSTRA